MKKIYSILVLVLVFAATASAHGWQIKSKRSSKSAKAETRAASLRSVKPFETVLPDSAVVFGEDNERYSKMLYSYDTDGSIVEQSEYEKTVTKYDDKGRIVKKEYYSLDYYMEEYILIEREETVYYSGDKIKQQTYMWNDTPYGGTVSLEKTIIEYDSQGYMVSAKGYEDLDGDGVITENDYTTEYSIIYMPGEDGLIEYGIQQRPAGSSEEFMVITIQRVKYDSENKLIYSQSDYYDTEINDWEFESAHTYEYNTNGKLVSETSRKLNFDTWLWDEFNWKETYTYDANGNLTLSEYFWKNEEIRDQYNVYYYDNASGIGYDKTATHNVSIVDGVLNVNTANAETVSVYMVSGTKLFAFDKSEGEASANIGNDAKGVVIVKGSTGWAEKAIIK